MECFLIRVSTDKHSFFFFYSIVAVYLIVKHTIDRDFLSYAFIDKHRVTFIDIDTVTGEKINSICVIRFYLAECIPECGEKS